MSGTLLKFQPRSIASDTQTAAEFVNNYAHHQVGSTLVKIESQSFSSASNNLLDASSLYPTISDEDGAVARGIALLAEAELYLQTALGIDPQIDYISFDTLIMKSRLQLQSAFGLRSIGDGYAAVVNALNLGLKNAEVEPLNKQQLRSIIDALMKTRRGPFLHFDSAMLILDSLEDSGIDIEPVMMNDFIQADYDEDFSGNYGTY